MAALIQRVAVQAYKTFNIHRGTSSFSESLATLRTLVNQLSKRDINFDDSLVGDDEIYLAGGRKAPVTYIHMHEDDVFSMGIFVLRNGASLPLHDHPGMHGIIKVLHGKMTIRSFSATGEPGDIPNDVTTELNVLQRRLVLPVMLHGEHELNTDSETCSLTPTDGNFHEITSVDGPAAFLDILSPPYNESRHARRECHYYRELILKKKEGSPPGTRNGPQDSYLIQVPQPLHFWGESANYLGPDIDPYGNIS